MSYETPEVSLELLNQSFVDKVFNGQIKEAEEASSGYIRLKMYEDGILRRLFEAQMKGEGDLDPLMDSDQPSIIVELEPDAPRATFVTYKGTGDRAYFNGKRFRVPFGKVESDRISKNKFELMTIRMQITDWLKEHQVKAIQEEEDKLFIETLEDIVQTNAAQQVINISMAANPSFKDAFTEGWKALTRLRLPGGKVLMHKNTYLDSLKLKIDEIGNTPIESRFNRGVDGEDSFMGSPVVTTIKDNLVPENTIWFFTQPEYFIKYYMLQDATLFLRTEADMIHFHTYESVGIGIGNTNGVVKLVLN